MKKRNAKMSMGWVSGMLIGMGVLFLAAGIIVGVATAGQMPMFGWLFPLAFGGPGLILMLVGIFMLRRSAGKSSTKKRLMEEGSMEWLPVTDVEMQYNIRVNGKSPYVIFCNYQGSDGRIYRMKSSYLNFNPSQMLPNGRVKVYLDRENPANYYIDVDGSLTNEVWEV